MSTFALPAPQHVANGGIKMSRSQQTSLQDLLGERQQEQPEAPSSEQREQREQRLTADPEGGAAAMAAAGATAEAEDSAGGLPAAPEPPAPPDGPEVAAEDADAADAANGTVDQTQGAPCPPSATPKRATEVGHPPRCHACHVILSYRCRPVLSGRVTLSVPGDHGQPSAPVLPGLHRHGRGEAGAVAAAACQAGRSRSRSRRGQRQGRRRRGGEPPTPCQPSSSSSSSPQPSPPQPSTSSLEPPPLHVDVGRAAARLSEPPWSGDAGRPTHHPPAIVARGPLTPPARRPLAGRSEDGG